MKEIKADGLAAYGAELKCHEMDNGEKRFRLIGSDGSAYIRTEADSRGGWQKSHCHTKMRELYLVQKGEIILAELKDGEVRTKRLGEGEFCITEPNTPHNIYMFPGTVTHTLKFGDCSDADWNACGELDWLVSDIDIKQD
jgi:hypothetical protein